MANKNNADTTQVIDFTSSPSVHIAGVTCSSHVSPTTSFQALSRKSEPKSTEELGTDVPSRFWERVAVKSPSECWPWLGSVDRDGYGRASLKGKKMLASRLAYILATGKNPEDLLVCHHCDNPPCCNPSHLYAGTKSDNERDKFKRGKTHRGEKNPAGKLSEDQVQNIRRLFDKGMTNVAIGKMMGVHHSTISKIRTGGSWGTRR